MKLNSAYGWNQVIRTACMC